MTARSRSIPRSSSLRTFMTEFHIFIERVNFDVAPGRLKGWWGSPGWSHRRIHYNPQSAEEPRA